MKQNDIDFSIQGRIARDILFTYNDNHYRVDVKEVLKNYSGRDDWRIKWDLKDWRIFIFVKGENAEIDGDEIDLSSELPEMINNGLIKRSVL